MSKYKSNLGVVYSCKYHMIFCPKYRRKALEHDSDARLIERRLEIIETEVMPDHGHILLKVDPQRDIHQAEQHEV